MAPTPGFDYEMTLRLTENPGRFWQALRVLRRGAGAVDVVMRQERKPDEVMPSHLLVLGHECRWRDAVAWRRLPGYALSRLRLVRNRRGDEVFTASHYKGPE